MTLLVAVLSLLSACGEVVLPDAEALMALRSAKAGSPTMAFEGRVVDQYGFGIKGVEVDITLYQALDPGNGGPSDSIPTMVTNELGRYGIDIFPTTINTNSIKVVATDPQGRYNSDSQVITGFTSTQARQKIVIPTITLRAL